MMTVTSDPWHPNADISTSQGLDSSLTAYPGVFAFGLLLFGYYTVSSTSRLRGLCLAGAAPSCHVMSLAECLGAF